MFPKTLLIIGATAALTSALAVPHGRADGVYLHTFDERGFENVTKIPGLKFPKKWGKLGTRAALPDQQLGCSSGDTPPMEDVQAALTKLGDTCDRGDKIASHDVITAVQGKAVFYTCNYSDNEQGCGRQEATDAMNSIKGRCGGNAGWDFLHAWNKNYGYATTGAAFCTNLH